MPTNWNDTPLVFLSQAHVMTPSGAYLPEIVLERSTMALEIPVGVTFTAVIRDHMSNHYFHFVETLIWLYATARELGSTVERIVFGRDGWSNPSQADCQWHLVRLLFPRAEVISALSPEGMDFGGTIVIDRGRERTPMNKFVEQSLPFSPRWVPDMARTVAVGCGGAPLRGASSGLKAIYVVRKFPRRLAQDVEDSLLARLSDVCDVAIVDFAGMEFTAQVRTAYAADIMIGVHGNGLTNALWMKPGSTLVEIFPPNVRTYDYQLLAELAGLDYFGLDRHLVYRDFGRLGPYPGEHPEFNSPILDLDISIVRAVVERIGVRR